MLKPHLRRQQQLSHIREELRRLPGLTISGVLTAESADPAVVGGALVAQETGQDRRRHHGEHAGHGGQSGAFSAIACPTEDLYQQLPATLQIREFRNGRRVLVTTLLDPQQASVSALSALYQTRWHGELDLRAIKQVLGMDILRCQSPDMVEKEIAVHLPAYNLLRALLGEAARQAKLAPRTLSFKAALQALLAQGALLWLGELSVSVIQALLARLARERVGDRPGRCEPRAIKRRPKPQALLKQPRAVARRRLRRQPRARAA